jgi:hypothetical protein
MAANSKVTSMLLKACLNIPGTDDRFNTSISTNAFQLHSEMLDQVSQDLERAMRGACNTLELVSVQTH